MNSAEVKYDYLLNTYKYLIDFYFGNIGFDTIQSLNPKKNEDFNIESLTIVSRQIGLAAIEKNISACDIAHHLLPCIVFNEQNKPFVYLRNTADKTMELYDAVEEKTFEINRNELNKYKKAVFIFKERPKAGTADKAATNKWFWQPVKSFWKSYIEVGILTFFINLFALFVPLYIMIVYDRVVPNEANETLFVLSFGLIIALIFELVFKSVRSYIIDKTAKKLSLYLEEDLMKRLLGIQSQYDIMMTGTKANLFRELAAVRDFFATKSIIQIIDFPFFIFAIIAICFISPVIALIPLAIALIIMLINIGLQIPIGHLSKKHLQNTQSKHNYLIETIQGSDAFKLSNATASKLFNWRNIIAFGENIQVKIQSVNAFALNISQTLIQLTTILVVSAGVFQIADKNLSIGGLIAVTILASRAMIPVISLSTMLIKFKEIKDSLHNLKEFWNLPQENEKNIELGVGSLRGDIEFRDVTYYFQDSKLPSINKLNLKIKSGEKVGIIGQTGAGKSTILKLLTGLVHPTQGSVFIDNHDISTIHPAELRKNIGVMTQEPYLFNGTLKENIELSNPISKERMMELVVLSGLEDLVKNSPHGEGIVVGERGANLSVGQKHLVGLARAIVNDPPILILDEPTTGLDVGLEKKLMDNLNNIIQGKTLILITHRFAALELVERIIIIDNGKVVADGHRDVILNALKTPKGVK